MVPIVTFHFDIRSVLSFPLSTFGVTSHMGLAVLLFFVIFSFAVGEGALNDVRGTVKVTGAFLVIETCSPPATARVRGMRTRLAAASI